MDKLNEISNKIKTLLKSKTLVLVGIDGRGGAGKTTLALLIKEQFPGTKIITTDDFYNEEINKIDENIIKEKLLDPFSKGLPATYIEFDGKARKPRTVEPKGIIIIEGVYSTHSLIENYYDLAIWIESSVENVNNRVKKRDGYYDKGWEKFHRPNEDKYIADDKPQQRANIVIDNNLLVEELSNLGYLWKRATSNK